MLAKRPGKIIWETESPEKTLLMSNGTKLWYYTPPFDPTDKSEPGEYHVSAAGKRQSELAQNLLAGSFSFAKDLKFSQLNSTEFTLKPKTGTAGTVVEARIKIEPRQMLIQKVTLVHKDGNPA